MSKAIFKTYRYLKHLFASSSRLSVHSPYLFSLYSVMKKSKDIPLNPLLQARFNELKSDKSMLSYLDLGSKGGIINTTISHLASTSLKPAKQASAIASIVRFQEPDLIIELGTSFGITTACMHLEAPQAKLISIEGIKDIFDHANSTLNLFPNASVELKCGAFDQILPEIVALPSSKCFAFVDGNHRFEPTIKYVNLLAKMNTQSLIIAIDDIYASKDMALAWAELVGNYEFQASIDFYHFGVLIKRNGLSKQHFMLRL